MFHLVQSSMQINNPQRNTKRLGILVLVLLPTASPGGCSLFF